jgi:hypothetical protein
MVRRQTAAAEQMAPTATESDRSSDLPLFDPSFVLVLAAHQPPSICPIHIYHTVFHLPSFLFLLLSFLSPLDPAYRIFPTSSSPRYPYTPLADPMSLVPSDSLVQSLSSRPTAGPPDPAPHTISSRRFCRAAQVRKAQDSARFL